MGDSRMHSSVVDNHIETVGLIPNIPVTLFFIIVGWGIAPRLEHMFLLAGYFK